MLPTDCQQIVRVKLLEDRRRHLAVYSASIAEAGSIVKIACENSFVRHVKGQVESHSMLDTLTCVNEEQINSHVTSLVLQVGGESNEVTPVRTIVLLLEMTL